jgi:hypothetical protein
MTDDDWKTLRVPADAWEQAQEQRQEAGRTWGEQVVRPEGDENGGVAEEVRELRNRLDDLEGRLPRKVAEELR